MLFSSVMVRHWRCRSTTFATKRSWRWNLPVRSVSCYHYVIFVRRRNGNVRFCWQKENNKIIISAADLHCNWLQRVLPCSCCFQVHSKHLDSHLVSFGSYLITFWHKKKLSPRALGCERPAFYTGIVIMLFGKYVKMIVHIVYIANLSIPYFCLV